MLRRAVHQSTTASRLATPVTSRRAQQVPAAARRSFAGLASRRPSAHASTSLQHQHYYNHHQQLPPTLATLRAFSTTPSPFAAMRTESDAFGEIPVPDDKYWGAQTERSLGNFKINQPQDRMPPPIVRAFGVLKGAAATANMKYGLGKDIPWKEWTCSHQTNSIYTLYGW